MSVQAPAVPKARRWARLAWARLGLAPRSCRPASERAALALRQRPARPPGDPTVVFLIPVVGRHHVGDFDAVRARLLRTLGSLAAQTDGHWHALVCTQEDPGLPDDPRIRFLPFTQSAEGNDKWPKLAALAHALPALGVKSGYAMPFDADDLLHPEAVAEMRRRKAPGGYLAVTGYVRDVASGKVAEAGPQRPRAIRRKPFWKLCGSCAAFAFDLTEDHRDVAFLAAVTAHEHRMFPYLAALAGRPLAPFTAPRVLYELNHGENFGARRGRGGFKTRMIARHAIADAGTLEEISQAFGD